MKRPVFAVLLAMLIATPAMAAYQGPGSSTPITEIIQVQNGQEDAICILEGNLVEKVSGKKDKYVLKDATGQIIIEIDDKLFTNKKVTPENKVRVHGRVDKSKKGDSKEDMVDAYFLEIL